LLTKRNLGYSLTTDVTLSDFFCSILTKKGMPMSDGPHRSLRMRKPWKELAKRGDQAVYDSSEVITAATAALASDFKCEVSWHLIRALKSVFLGFNNSLRMVDAAIDQLKIAKAKSDNSVFASNAIAWSMQLIRENKFGLDAFYEAIGLAAKQRGFAGVRSVEEHYLRESNSKRADRVGQRLTSAICSISDGKLGIALAGPQQDAVDVGKKAGIDDGVPLL
jgi:hypothetical protein